MVSMSDAGTVVKVMPFFSDKIWRSVMLDSALFIESWSDRRFLKSIICSLRVLIFSFWSKDFALRLSWLDKD